jgi:hypothetical protein
MYKEKIILIKTLKHILGDLKQALKMSREGEKQSESDFLLRQGMLEGIQVIEGRINLFTHHQKSQNKRLSKKQRRLVTKNICLSDGRYRKFEWYEGKMFYSLAFRQAKEDPIGEIALQIQETKTLDNQYFIYIKPSQVKKPLDYEDLVKHAKQKGIQGLDIKDSTKWKKD